MPVLLHKRAEAPIVRSLLKTPSASPVSMPSSHSTLPSSTPSSPMSSVLVGPVAMGTVEEIKNALIESNRVAAERKVRNLRIIL